MIKASWLASGVVLVGVVVFAACSSDDDNKTVAGTSGKGQACQKTSDCATGLACLPSSAGIGGTCVPGVFSLIPTGKECVTIDCQAPKDCCPQLTGGSDSVCTNLKATCDEETDAGFGTTNAACEEYKSECVCDDTQYTCINNTCGQSCKDDADCTSNAAPKCLGGACGACVIDTDCASQGSNYTCVNAKCKPPCQTDGDCSNFDRCITGKCTPGGCQSDRECVYALNREDATCGTDGRCTTPCQSDTECGDPVAKYNYMKCNAGKCQFIGCQEDKDCTFFANGSSITSSSSGNVIIDTNPNSHVVCQFPTTPTSATGK